MAGMNWGLNTGQQDRPTNGYCSEFPSREKEPSTKQELQEYAAEMSASITTSIRERESLDYPSRIHQTSDAVLAREISCIEKVKKTNTDCTSSKCSVEKLYYPPPHFYEFLPEELKGAQRKPTKAKDGEERKFRSPFVNRGYWLRMQIVERSLLRFLKEAKGSRRIILNLGCGFDLLPFRVLATHPDLCKGTTFVDVDFESVMLRKVKMIRAEEKLRLHLDKLVEPQDMDGFLLWSENYAALSCDLTDIGRLEKAIRGAFSVPVTFLVVSEVSTTYMKPEEADALIAWASSLGNVRFHLLEQFLPNGRKHPFADTMLYHFARNQSPLQVIEKYPQLEDQVERFNATGWQSVFAKSLWDLWRHPEFFSTSDRIDVNNKEQFDEWEEFVHYSSHYFFLTAQISSILTTFEQPCRTILQPTQSHTRVPYTRKRDDRQSNQRELATRENDHACFEPRRFAVLYQSEKGVFELYGGEDGSERLSILETFFLSHQLGPAGPSERPSYQKLVHHSVTPLSVHFDCFISGGREAPKSILSECWLKRDGQWQRVHDLPVPLYRHAATLIRDSNNEDGVLVFGGKTLRKEGHQVCATWYLWQDRIGWRTVECTNEKLTPRFSANLISLGKKNIGLLLGGMSEDGVIQQEWYRWAIDTRGHQPRLELSSCGDIQNVSVCRIGACFVNSRDGLFLIGGVQSSGLPPPGFEVWKLSYSLNPENDCLSALDWSTVPNWNIEALDPQPLLIGHSAIYDGEGIVVIGGGAVCFSFGRYMNENIWRFDKRGECEISPWRLARRVPEISASDGESKRRRRTPPPQVSGRENPRAGLPKIPRMGGQEPEAAQDKVHQRTPYVLESMALGPCTTKWTSDYLKRKIGPKRLFDVHYAQDDTMLFESKNFMIKKNTFPEFMDAVVNGEKRYLRSLSPSDVHKPANFSKDFPTLDADFSLPSMMLVPDYKMHSSILRISGPINMWLHYDTMPNFLCQICGIKRLILFPPEDVDCLHLSPGRSSSDLDVFEPKAFEKHPLSLTHPREAILRPGDILFIPALWCHAALPVKCPSVAVNTFFKTPDDRYYSEGVDTYGNKDVSEYVECRRAIAKLKSLSPDKRMFYLKRAMQEISDSIHNIG